ncbi:hypothetical protein [Nonomuraea sp. NPDC049400]|uniref:hypothetical protein n=1 Tax=Nonomuraea sp. NPDC049400 TaxID=3364352 RepID=UPI0037967277
MPGLRIRLMLALSTLVLAMLSGVAAAGGASAQTCACPEKAAPAPLGWIQW